jgi:hypothetical protein
LFNFRLGQALCMHGSRPQQGANNVPPPQQSSSSSSLTTLVSSDHVLANVINVGVGNLPLTVRTDLANRCVVCCCF